MKKEIIDRITSKLISRKLLVFAVSVWALIAGKLDGESWVIVSTAYIGVEGAIDAVTRLKGIKNINNNG